MGRNNICFRLVVGKTTLHKAFSINDLERLYYGFTTHFKHVYADHIMSMIFIWILILYSFFSIIFRKCDIW